MYTNMDWQWPAWCRVSLKRSLIASFGIIGWQGGIMCLSESYAQIFVAHMFGWNHAQVFWCMYWLLKQLSSMCLDWNIFLLVGACVTSRPKPLWFNKKSLYTPGPFYFNRKTFKTCKRDRSTLLHSVFGTHSRKNAKQNTVLQLHCARSLWGLSLFRWSWWP